MAAESKPFLSPHSSGDTDLEQVYSSTSLGQSKSTWQGWKKSIIQLIATFTLATAFGFFLGRRSKYPTSAKSLYGGLLRPNGHIKEIWEHNLTFSQAPTPYSEAAWNSLIPPGRGFIHQPEIAPFISNIATFHQIHCLHAILVAYYASTDTLAYLLGDEKVDKPQELYGARIETDHIRHCFDYLRRSIMCAADTNLEVVDRVNHTTNGWGQEKTCRDYGAVMEYAVRWANTSDVGIVAGMPKVDKLSSN